MWKADFISLTPLQCEMVVSWEQTGTSLMGRPGSIPSPQSGSVAWPPSPPHLHPPHPPAPRHQRNMASDSRASPNDFIGEENIGQNEKTFSYSH